MTVELDVRDSAEEAVRAAAAELARAAAAGGHVALSGGSARAAYEHAAALEPRWGGVELWWVDERCVPPDDERSNYRLVRESLLERVTEPPGTVHRVAGELEPDDAADRYDDELGGVTLDFAFLGLGPDGHTASLFPHAPSLRERERRAVAAAAGLDPFVDRVTLTIPVLEAAAVALYLVTGEAKADAVRRAFRADPDEGTPASLVRGRRTVALLDRDAAALLETRPGPGI